MSVDEMIRGRVVPVVLSVLVIVLVAILQERSRHLAAILATAPVTAPLAMWIVYGATRGDSGQTAEFAGSMIMGAVGSLVFVLVCWLGLRQGWGLAITLAAAGAIWLVVAFLPRLLGSWPR